MTRRAAAPAPTPLAGGARGGSAAVDLSAADAAFLERLAVRVVALGLAAPALLALDGTAPLAGLAGHAGVFLQPLAAALFGASDVERIGRLLARRDTVARLADRVATLAGARR
jgi:hypothetical protein